MPTEKDKDSGYLVPGRITLDQLHKEQAELKEAREISEKNPGPKLLNAMSMLSVALDFALMIAVPLVAFIFLGRWLDNKYNQKFFVLIGLGLAMVISVMSISKQVKKLSELIKKK